MYRAKYVANGNVKKYKACLVVKGCSQVVGIDYGEKKIPVAKMTSIDFLLSIVVAYDLEVEKMDVKTTFLHGYLEEEIYMTQPQHFVVKGKSYLVCKLKKSLYGLKQSPRMWYRKFHTYVLSLGFVRSKSDHYIYYKSNDHSFLVIVLYVDDMLFIGKG